MLFLEHILELPRVVITSYTLDRLPPIRCLYFVVKYSKIMYIGRSENLKVRWEDHHKTLMCYELECDLHWLKFEDPLGLVKAETKHILFHAPPWNSFSHLALNLGRNPKDVVEDEQQQLVNKLKAEIKSQEKKIKRLQDEISKKQEGESSSQPSLVDLKVREISRESGQEKQDKNVYRESLRARIARIGR